MENKKKRKTGPSDGLKADRPVGDKSGPLLQNQLELSQVMDLARIVYWGLDPATETFIFNDPFYALYRTTAEREGGYLMAREEYARRFIHPDDLPLFLHAGDKRHSHREGEFFHDFEHRIIRRDGELRHVVARIRAILDGEGRIIRCYGANQDITERKNAEEQLERERLLKEIQLQRGKALERSREEAAEPVRAFAARPGKETAPASHGRCTTSWVSS